jgi:hypothetical protein
MSVFLFKMRLALGILLYDFKAKFRPKLTDVDRKAVCLYQYEQQGWTVGQISSFYNLPRAVVLGWIKEKHPEVRD